MTELSERKSGRERLPEEDVQKVRGVRFSDAEWDYVMRHGGAVYLRGLLRKDMEQLLPRAK